MLDSDIGAATQSEVNEACTYSVIRHPVDEDKASGITILFIGVEGDVLVQTQITLTNAIEFQFLCCQMLHRIDVYLVLYIGDCCRN